MKKIFLLITFFSLSVHSEQSSFPRDSVYHLKSTWLTQDNQSVVLKDFKGTPVIISMVYTGCAHACPMTIAKIQEVEELIVKAGIKNYKIVLASFDTLKDNPRHLKKYMKSRKLDETRWIFLSTPKESTARELAVVLGINYKAVGGGDFSHSNVISYIDENGVLKSKLENLSSDIEPFVKTLQKDGI